MSKPSTTPDNIHLIALSNFPLVKAGDDLCEIILTSCRDNNISLEHGDVLVLAQKIVSKAENRFRRLSNVNPSSEALKLAEQTELDSRFLELVLQESSSIIRFKQGLIITEHKQGYISANAGIDHSNVQKVDNDDVVLLLPEDANHSAKRLREKLKESLNKDIHVVINDSFGRPWRLGSVGIALGSSGFKALDDMRHKPDLFGRELQGTEIAIADEIAAAASLVMGQANEGKPAVIIKGLDLEFSDTHDCKELIRKKSEDMFR